LSFCKYCSDRGVDHAALKQRFKDDFYSFARHICGFQDLDPILHRTLCEWVQEGLADGDTRFLLIIPRGHLKTSLMDIALPLFNAVNNPEIKMLQVHAAAPIAQDTTGVSKQIILGPRFGHFFPELVPDTTTAGLSRVKWNRHQYEVNRKGAHKEGTMTAVGVKTVAVGLHFDWQFFDDVIDFNASRSPDLVERAIDYHDQSVPLFVNPDTGVRMVTGTWWEGGFYEHVMEIPSYNQCVLGCYVDDRFFEFFERIGKLDRVKDYRVGDPIFPLRDGRNVGFTKDSLRRIEREMSTWKFTNQYLNYPVEDDLRRFSEKDIRYYELQETFSGELYAQLGDERISLRNAQFTISCDPASGENLRTDESAINVCAYDRESGIAFVVEEWGGRVLPDKLITRLLETAIRWQRHSPGRRVTIGVEQAALQSVVRHWLEQEMKRRRCSFDVVPIKIGARSKAERIIDGLQPFVRNGQVYFLRDQKTLIDEMINLRISKNEIRGKSPNRVDAIANQTMFWELRVMEDEDDEDEIPYATEFHVFFGSPCYGLGCVT